MTELQQKQLAFLEETIAHYNTKNRAVGVNGTCQYSQTETSEGCAVGRHIADKGLCEKLDRNEYKESGVSNDDIFHLLPDNLKELGQEFLKEVQLLHDEQRFWDEDGLGEDGIWKAIQIKNKFALN